MHKTSESTRLAPGDAQHHAAEGETENDQKAGGLSKPPRVDSPPIAPQPSGQSSPWWTAPGGKAVDIPAFGRALIEAALTVILPAPKPALIRIRTRR